MVIRACGKACPAFATEHFKTATGFCNAHCYTATGFCNAHCLLSVQSSLACTDKVTHVWAHSNASLGAGGRQSAWHAYRNSQCLTGSSEQAGSTHTEAAVPCNPFLSPLNRVLPPLASTTKKMSDKKLPAQPQHSTGPLPTSVGRGTAQ
eukprot:789513-Pelagomonas_calceolata.AAC.4